MPTGVEIIQRVYAPQFRVWDAGVLDHMYEHVWHPDIDWRAIEGAPDDVGVMHGRDRLRRYYEEWLELFDDITIEASEISEAGEHVVARARVSARSRSGIQTELNFAVVYTLLGGKVCRGREYASWDEALAAVGAPLSPARAME